MTVPQIQTQYRVTREIAKKIRNKAKNERCTIAQAHVAVVAKLKAV